MVKTIEEKQKIISKLNEILATGVTLYDARIKELKEGLRVERIVNGETKRALDLSGESSKSMMNLRGTNLLALFTPEELKYVELEYVDLREANLAGANLEGVSLRCAKLMKANLQGVDLGKANLAGASLHGTNLYRTNLAGASLHRAKPIKANLAWTDLRKANLAWINLRGANLTGANLKEACLYKAKLINANLQGVDLEGADLEDTNLAEANLEWADLRGTKLSGADLQEANLSRTNLTMATGKTIISTTTVCLDSTIPDTNDFAELRAQQAKCEEIRASNIGTFAKVSKSANNCITKDGGQLHPSDEPSIMIAFVLQHTKPEVAEGYRAIIKAQRATAAKKATEGLSR